MRVRPRWDGGMPAPVLAQIAAYESERNGRAWFHAVIPSLAPSTNRVNRHDRNGHTWKDKSAKTFEKEAMVAFWGKHFAPTGVIAAILVFESQHWLDATQIVQRRDLDNKIKVTIDACRDLLRFPDEHVWCLHDYKLVGRAEATHVWMFDLGDVVPAYSRHAHQ